MQAGRAYCREKLRQTQEIRELALAGLDAIRTIVTVPRAEGAFYLLLRVHTEADPMNIVRCLIEEHGVAVIPGSTFGATGECLLRIAYGALRKDTAQEGIDRLVHGLRQILTR
jgi:aspartate/methionine/tyrosine aminotransferase